jgi:hypothetical protein
VSIISVGNKLLKKQYALHLRTYVHTKKKNENRLSFQTVDIKILKSLGFQVVCTIQEYCLETRYK